VIPRPETWAHRPLALDEVQARTLPAAWPASPEVEPVAMTSAEERQIAVEAVQRIGRVAHVPVRGMIFKRLPPRAARAGLTAQNILRDQIDAALADEDTDAVVVDIDSPGGVADGLSGVARQIRTRTRHKPIVAFVDGNALSGGYMLAAGTQRIVARPESLVGSIGVIPIHMDFSRALENEGITTTIVKAGAKKANGNPLEPLSKEALADIRKRVDRLYDDFVGLVAESRGISAAAVRATEAGVLPDDEALPAGLIDEVATLDDLLESLNREIGGRTVSTGTQAPATPAASATPQAPPVQTPSVQTPETSEPAAANDAALAAARREGAEAERQRIEAILCCEAAQGREATARQLALTPGMTATQAGKILESVPQAAAPPAGDPAIVANLAEAAAVPDPGPDPAVGAASEDTPHGRAQAIINAGKRG